MKHETLSIRTVKPKHVRALDYTGQELLNYGQTPYESDRAIARLFAHSIGYAHTTYIKNMFQVAATIRRLTFWGRLRRYRTKKRRRDSDDNMVRAVTRVRL